MQKRAQLSIFLIVIVVLLGAVMLIQFVNDQEEIAEPSVSDSGEVLALDTFVSSCLEQTLEEAVYDVMLQGGYYVDMPRFTSLLALDIPYYWDEDKNVMPSLNQIEEEIAAYVFDTVDFCFNGFTELQTLGFEIETEFLFGESEPLGEEEFPDEELETEIDVQITENNVQVLLNSPFRVTKGPEVFEKNNFVANVPIDVRRFHGYAEQIMQHQSESPNSLPMTDITILADSNDFYFETIFQEDIDTVIVGLVVDVPNKEPLIYNFAQQYDWSEFQ